MLKQQIQHKQIETLVSVWPTLFFFSTQGVKPLIHQSELGTYTKVVPFQEKSSFHFAVLWKLLNGMD